MRGVWIRLVDFGMNFDKKIRIATVPSGGVSHCRRCRVAEVLHDVGQKAKLRRNIV